MDGGVIVTRILFIPDMEGVQTAERTPLLYRTLKAGHDVIGLPAPLDRLIFDTARARLPRYALYIVDKALVAVRGLLLARRCAADLVMCATSHHALAGLAIAKFLGIRCIWESQGNVKLFSESLGKGWFFTRLNILVEKLLGQGVERLITVSERDAHAYIEMGVEPSKIHIIPISLVLSEIDAKLSVEPGAAPASPRSSGPPKLLFFGSFKYGPNLEALRFINTSLGPHLEKKGVTCEILVAGRDIPDVPYHPFVKTLGFVDEIHQLIHSCDLSLVPIWKGVGILTKVLDAMGAGTPVVLTEFVARLMPEIQDGVNAFVASSEEEFSEKVLDALSDPSACETVTHKARQLVEKRYDWALYIDYLERIVRGETAGPEA